MITTRAIFDRQLCSLGEHVQKLGQMVSESIALSMKALETHDLNAARQVDENDANINALRFAIEEESYCLLALQQPVSVDMRKIVATVSIVTNPERMGDHAAGIARLVLRMGNQQRAVTVPEFAEMGVLIQQMLQDSVKAFVRQDRELARSVVERDSEMDLLHKQAYNRLVEYMSQNPANIECGTFSLWISHNLERIGDRCTTICERVNYLVTGELIRHPDPMP